MSDPAPSGVTGTVLKAFQGKFGIFLAGAAITCAVIVLYAVRPAWMDFQENKVYDFLMRSGNREPVSGDVVIVDIDEKSLAALGQWPWPRYRLALLLGMLRQAKVAAVGLDILLAEPDRTSPVLLEHQFKEELSFDVSFTGLPEQLRDYDKALGAILRNSPFVLAVYFDFAQTGSAPDQQACDLPKPSFSNLSPPGAVPPLEAAMRATDAICPLPVLLASGASAGFINMPPDLDNIIRRAPLLIGYAGSLQPSLALASFIKGRQVTARKLYAAEAGLKSMVLESQTLGARTIPVDSRGQVLINFRGPGGLFPRISASDVLQGSMDKAAVAGKIALLGSTAVGLRDIVATPYDRAMPGLEVQATVVDMLQKGDFILRPDWAPSLEAGLILLAGLLAAALLAVAKGVWLVIPIGVIGAGIWYGAVAALDGPRFFIQPLYPLIALGLNFIALTVFKFWREENKRRFIHSAFAHYLSPKVVDQIVASPEKLNLTGEEREVSILFSDIRGFTTISEKLSPTQLVDLLHEYLTPMTRLVTGHLGTLDKYIGDAVMAFWNAPVPVAGHRREAILAALGMVEELARLNEGFKEKYGLTLAIGVGLNCGHVRVGNFGSMDLFSYTIIGDNVNLCSRLEGLTKFYGLSLVVGEGMIGPDSAEFYFQEVDRVLVKGKHEPVTIYTPMTAAAREKRSEELALAEQALALYRTMDFAGAGAMFADLYGRTQAKLYGLYKERCEALIADPPPSDWNGVFEHKSK